MYELSEDGKILLSINQDAEYLDIPESVIIINNGIFWNNKKLISINIPKLKKINYHIFNGCINLKFISLPNCRYIESTTFNGCASLEILNISENTGISDWSFFSCPNLKHISKHLTKQELIKIFGYEERANIYIQYQRECKLNNLHI